MFRLRLFALSIIMLVAVVAFAQPDWNEMSPEQQQEMMALWFKLGTPAEAHAYLEPLLDVQDRVIHSRLTIESEDKHVYTMYDLHAGPDYKVFEIVYERTK